MFIFLKYIKFCLLNGHFAAKVTGGKIMAYGGSKMVFTFLKAGAILHKNAGKRVDKAWKKNG